jgi:hypothetical protein
MQMMMASFHAHNLTFIGNDTPGAEKCKIRLHSAPPPQILKIPHLLQAYRARCFIVWPIIRRPFTR